MFPVCRDALARLRATPWTVAAGGGLVVADLLAASAVVLASPVLPSFGPLFAIAGVAVAQVVWVPLATPVLVAGYRLAVGDDSQASIGAAINERAPGTLAALVAERGVALVLAPLAVPLVVGVALGLHTVGKAAWYVVDPTVGVAPVGLVVLLGVTAVTAGLTLARLPAAFVAPLVALDGTTPRAALRHSGRLVRRRPVATLRYWLGSTALGLPLFLLVGVASIVDPPAYGPIAAAYAVVAIPARSLAVAARVAFLERVGRPAVDGSPRQAADAPPRPAQSTRAPSAVRVGLAVALAVALVAGVAAVRTAEHRPTGTADPMVVAGEREAEPTALVAAGSRQLRASSFRKEIRTTTYNASTGESTGTLVWRWAVDRRSKRIRMSVRRYHPNGSLAHAGWDSYLGEGLFAQTVDDGSPPAPGQAPGSTYGDSVAGRGSTGVWEALPVPVYASVGRVVADEHDPGRDAPWRVTDRSDGNVTLAVSGTAAHRATTFSLRDDHPISEDSYVRATFDRGTGRLLRVEERLRTAPAAELESRFDRRRVTTYAGYGTTDVRRPDGLGPRTPLEWLWDLAYY